MTIITQQTSKICTCRIAPHDEGNTVKMWRRKATGKVLMLDWKSIYTHEIHNLAPSEKQTCWKSGKFCWNDNVSGCMRLWADFRVKRAWLLCYVSEAGGFSDTTVPLWIELLVLMGFKSLHNICKYKLLYYNICCRNRTSALYFPSGMPSEKQHGCHPCSFQPKLAQFFFLYTLFFLLSWSQIPTLFGGDEYSLQKREQVISSWKSSN